MYNSYACAHTVQFFGKQCLVTVGHMFWGIMVSCLNVLLSNSVDGEVELGANISNTCMHIRMHEVQNVPGGCMQT